MALEKAVPAIVVEEAADFEQPGAEAEPVVGRDAVAIADPDRVGRTGTKAISIGMLVAAQGAQIAPQFRDENKGTGCTSSAVRSTPQIFSVLVAFCNFRRLFNGLPGEISGESVSLISAPVFSVGVVNKIFAPLPFALPLPFRCSIF